MTHVFLGRLQCKLLEERPAGKVSLQDGFWRMQML